MHPIPTDPTRFIDAWCLNCGQVQVPRRTMLCARCASRTVPTATLESDQPHVPSQAAVTTGVVRLATPAPRVLDLPPPDPPQTPPAPEPAPPPTSTERAVVGLPDSAATRRWLAATNQYARSLQTKSEKLLKNARAVRAEAQQLTDAAAAISELATRLGMPAPVLTTRVHHRQIVSTSRSWGPNGLAACTACQGTQQPHSAHGWCRTCYPRERAKQQREQQPQRQSSELSSDA